MLKQCFHFSYTPKAKPAHGQLRFEEFFASTPPANDVYEDIDDPPPARRKSEPIQRRATPPIIMDEVLSTDGEKLTRSKEERSNYSPNVKPAHAGLQFEDTTVFYSESTPSASQIDDGEIAELPPARRSPPIQYKASPPIVFREEPSTDRENLTRKTSFSGKSSNDSGGVCSGPFGIDWGYWILGAILLLLTLIGAGIGLYFGLRANSKHSQQRKLYATTILSSATSNAITKSYFNKLSRFHVTYLRKSTI